MQRTLGRCNDSNVVNCEVTNDGVIKEHSLSLTRYFRYATLELETQLCIW